MSFAAIPEPADPARGRTRPDHDVLPGPILAKATAGRVDAPQIDDADAAAARVMRVIDRSDGAIVPGPTVAARVQRAPLVDGDTVQQRAASTPAARVQRATLGVIQRQEKPVVENAKLANYVNAIWKARPAGGAAVGDGSALAACSEEVGGGAMVGGADHQDKCRNILTGVTKLIGKHHNADSPVNLSAADLQAAMKLKGDLEDALAGNYEG